MICTESENKNVSLELSISEVVRALENGKTICEVYSEHGKPSYIKLFKINNNKKVLSWFGEKINENKVWDSLILNLNSKYFLCESEQGNN